MNQISVDIKNNLQEIICKVKGEWDGLLEYEYFNENKMTNSKSLNVNSLKLFRKRVRPVEMQDPYESRRLWSSVSNCIRKGDITMATNYKNTLEKNQRKHHEMKPRFFSNSSMQYEKNNKILSNYSSEMSELKLNARFIQLMNQSNFENETNKLETCSKNYWLHKNWNL
jgi:hypothetical protein